MREKEQKINKWLRNRKGHECKTQKKEELKKQSVAPAETEGGGTADEERKRRKGKGRAEETEF